MPSDVTNSVSDEPMTSSVSQASAPSASPLRSAELFDLYCGHVQEKLAAHAAQRMSFLQAAYDRLTCLLQAARDVEDTALYGELAQHRVAARELLEAARRLPQTLNASSAQETSSHRVGSGHVGSGHIGSSHVGSGHIGSGHVGSGYSGRVSALPPIATHHSQSRAGETALPPAPGYGQPVEHTPPAVNVPRMPRRPMRLLADIEADARGLREELKDWNSRHPLNTRQGELNIPNALRLRAVACRHRRLEEECGDTEVAEVNELAEDIMDLMDAANDQEYTVALDDELDPRPTAYQWGELADRYEDMARAQEGFEWWQRNRNLLTVMDVQPLAEAIAAVQQRFNRLLFRIGARDPFQQQLFDDLRTWAREDQCYLFSLRPKVPMAELVEKAARFEDAWERAKIPVAEESHRQQLIENVITLVSEPQFGEQLERDEERLRESLWECKNHRIPSSDRRLRDALLPWAVFLEGDERFKDILREINLEWERRQEIGRVEELEEEPESALDELTAELQAVRELTRGKRALILGGAYREEHRLRIETALELGELAWPSAKPSDSLARFDAEIRHADIVALVTRYSRKEWKNAQDVCAREGKKFVQLTSGHRASQVVRQLSNQLGAEGTGNTE